ncbi:hypothetical protein ACTFIV_005264 [Dictyostelium citrinum]
MGDKFSYWIEDNTYPKKWDINNQRDNQVFLVTIEKGSSEYITVSERFNETMSSSSEIVKLERIQNKTLWRNFDESRKKLNEKYKVSNLDFLESTLFHGTRSNDPKLIFSSDVGFDIGKSAFGSYGKGLYFALNASYSDRFCFRESSIDCKQMFLCRVLLGNSAPSNQRELQDDGQDSIKGGGGEMFILKANNTAYPDYLISYRQKAINKNNNNNNKKEIFDSYGFNTSFSQSLYDKYGLKNSSEEKTKPDSSISTIQKELEYRILPLLVKNGDNEPETSSNNDINPRGIYSHPTRRPQPSTRLHPYYNNSTNINNNNNSTTSIKKLTPQEQEEEDLKKAIELSISSSTLPLTPTTTGLNYEELDEDYQLALALSMSASDSK